MQRLKRVFDIDIEVCARCGGHVKVIANIEDPAVIEHILKHLKHKADNTDATHPILTRCHQSGHPLKPDCSTLHRVVYSTPRP